MYAIAITVLKRSRSLYSYKNISYLNLKIGAIEDSGLVLFTRIVLRQSS